MPAQPNQKVDLRDLGWEDRERVLRLLFAKINNVQGQAEALLQQQMEGSPQQHLSGGSNFDLEPQSSDVLAGFEPLTGQKKLYSREDSRQRVLSTRGSSRAGVRTASTSSGTGSRQMPGLA